MALEAAAALKAAMEPALSRIDKQGLAVAIHAAKEGGVAPGLIKEAEMQAEPVEGGLGSD